MATRRVDGMRRRAALLDAGLRLYARDGVLNVGIEEIRREAGASPSSVYHLFAGRNGLLLALLERTFTRLFGLLAERVVPTTTAQQAVEALVGAHLEWVLDNRDEARVMYQAMALDLGPGMADLQAAKAILLAPTVEHLDGFVAAGELPAWSPMTFEMVLLGPAHETCRRLLAGAPVDAGWMRETLPALAWRSLPPAG